MVLVHPRALTQVPTQVVLLVEVIIVVKEVLEGTTMLGRIFYNVNTVGAKVTPKTKKLWDIL